MFNFLNFDLDDIGVPDGYAQEADINGDGITDSLGIDIDGDGVWDAVLTDVNGDGMIDMVTNQYDSDGDGIFDTYISRYDFDGDGVFEVSEIYEISGDNGFEIFPVDDEIFSDVHAQQQWEPDNCDPEDVTGDPERSMEEWEYQGDTSRCAIYSQKFVIDELTGQDLDIEELADLAEEHGWFTEEGGTPLSDMNKLLDYFDVENEMSFHNDIDDIRECLDGGGKVIVSVDADEIWYGETDDLFSPNDGPNHAVEVIGMDDSDPDNPMVILNDSGTPDGRGEMVPLDVFLDAWEDGNCQMVECM